MAEHDLTGMWSGIYNYPHSHPPCAFEAQLRDVAGSLVGEITETEALLFPAPTQLSAMIRGLRRASAVRFTKFYDIDSDQYRPVLYDGILSTDGNEIAGQWSIPGAWSGSFIMIRAGGRAVAEEREAAASA
ncbi:hypothetical protein [Sandarakinorhabdus oryzae]|uniref:hypothetical protein n=1 Tax=Sandarakinorhabdus oryzae TaxID=2675220 RepID=UPI0012E0DE08|nr:hypothetical protein [Sandarakinorhabdus oryzae]